MTSSVVICHPFLHPFTDPCLAISLEVLRGGEGSRKNRERLTSIPDASVNDLTGTNVSRRDRLLSIGGVASHMLEAGRIMAGAQTFLIDRRSQPTEIAV